MSKTMKRAVWLGDKFEIQESPLPKIEDNQLLLSIAYAGICASDIHCMEEQLEPPTGLGHEFSAVVEKAGKDVTDFKKGDRVVAHPEAYCGECFFCRQAMESLCENKISIIEDTSRGSFQEYVAVERRQVYHIPDDISLKEAALVEPAAVAVHVGDISGIKTGQKVLIIGGGVVGLLTLQIVKLQGAGKIIVSEPEKSRRDLALELGADIAVDPLEDDLDKIVKENTDGRGVDVCLEAVGLPATIEEGFKHIRAGGRLVLVGLPSENSKVELNPHRINMQELDITGSYFSPYSFQRAIDLLPRLSLSSMITHCFNLEDTGKAFKTYREAKDRIKIIIKGS